MSSQLVQLTGLYWKPVCQFVACAGADVAPHYGDYEAQRHWMEVTIHLPVSEW